MAEGKITFAVGVESGDAIAGLKDISDGMDKMGQASSESASETIDALKKVDKATTDSVKNQGKQQNKAFKGLKKSRKENKKATNDQIQGLEGLKESTGEASSSMGALGGAIGVVNPAMGGMVSSAGALAGGMEGAAKGVKLLKGNVAGLLVTMGPMLVILGSLAAATAIFTFRTRKQAKEEEKIIRLSKQRTEAMRGLMGTMRALQIEDKLATGAVTEHQHALEMADAEREQGLKKISQIKDQLLRLSGDEQKAAEQEIKFMQFAVGETKRLRIVQADRAQTKVASDAAEEASASRKASREMAASKAEADAAEAAAKAAEALAKADAKAKEDADNRAKAQDVLAAATGQAAVIERSYAKAIMEANVLRAQGALSEQDLATVMTAAFDQRTAQIAAIAAAEQAASDASNKLRDDEVKAEAEKQKALFQSQLDGAQNRIGQAAEFTSTIGALVDTRAAQISQDLDQQEQAALARAEGNVAEQEKIKADFEARRASGMAKSFKVQKAVEIASVTMSGASAAIGALAPPPTGLGITLGAIAAPIIAATTAAQIALIASQSAPSFHQGGVIPGQGNQSITAQGGEVMLNKGAVAAMGGPAAANSLNSGSSGGGSIVVQMVYKQRVLDQLVVDNLAKGGPLKSALNNATRAGRRGRVGGLL
ncbi:MAG TPA: hypothetical protein EYN66_04105 [Myxococcales bacterium]|nr:hypothetical protein [Myxococcales bacterium]